MGEMGDEVADHHRWGINIGKVIMLAEICVYCHLCQVVGLSS